jgi:GAF domain-containing protein
MQALFATLADRIFDDWPDPAGLGPAISDDMDNAYKQQVRELLQEASNQATIAIDHVRRGRNGEALRVWRELFGPKFPLS